MKKTSGKKTKKSKTEFGFPKVEESKISVLTPSFISQEKLQEMRDKMNDPISFQREYMANPVSDQLVFRESEAKIFTAWLNEKWREAKSAQDSVFGMKDFDWHDKENVQEFYKHEHRMEVIDYLKGEINPEEDKETKAKR